MPIRSPEALADRITQLFDDEGKRLDMACAAKKTAGRMNWARYEAQIAGLVNGWSQSK